MYRFDIVGPIPLIATTGVHLQDESGQPAFVTWEGFALMHVGYDVFVANLPALQAARLQQKTLDEIESQRSEAAQRGFYLLEDDRGERLKNAVAATKLDARTAARLLPMLEAFERAAPFPLQGDT